MVAAILKVVKPLGGGGGGGQGAGQHRGISGLFGELDPSWLQWMEASVGVGLGFYAILSLSRT